MLDLQLTDAQRAKLAGERDLLIANITNLQQQAAQLNANLQAMSGAVQVIEQMLQTPPQETAMVPPDDTASDASLDPATEAAHAPTLTSRDDYDEAAPAEKPGKRRNKNGTGSMVLVRP